MRVASYPLAWPPEYTLSFGPNVVRLVDGHTGAAANWGPGDLVYVGGGLVGQEHLSTEIRERLGTCAHSGQQVWIVGDIGDPRPIANGQ